MARIQALRTLRITERPNLLCRSKLHGALISALNVDAVKRKFTDLGLEVVANTPEQFAARQREEYARWGKVMEVGKITAD